MSADRAGMAVDLTRQRVVLGAERFRIRTAELPARAVLGLMVGISAALRFALALGHVTPYHMPDEYIYGALARGLAETGRPVVRGAQAHFPALLEPLLAAPFWLPGDPVLAYRLTQGLHALAMSLAAVPVYLIGRRIGLNRRFSLACGALAAFSPETAYASFVMADPLGYPLALWALYAGVCTLTVPTRRGQLLFLGLAGLATFARVQYVILPVAFLLAAAVLERRSLGRALGRYRLTIGCLALALAGLLAVGAGRVLGYYNGVRNLAGAPGEIVRWLSVDSLLLAYASGWILVPAAVVAVAAGLVRPRSREEAAFAALTTAFGAGLLVEAALYASNGSSRFQERYLMALVPLVPLAFGLAHGRSRRAIAALGLTGFGIAAAVPLSGYAERAGSDSQFLSAVYQLGQIIGVADGAFVVALVAGTLSLVAVALAGRIRAAAAVGLALTACVGVAVSAGAASFDRKTSEEVRAAYLPADVQWVDHAGIGDVALLQTPRADAGRSLDQLFWNSSIRRVLLLPGARGVDALGSKRVRVTRSGALLAGNHALRGPLLVQTTGSAVLMTGAVRVAEAAGFELWRPAGMPRLALLAVGRDEHGGLAEAGSITLWPGSQRRVLRLTLSVPRGLPAESFVLQGAGMTRRAHLAPGANRTLSIPLPTGPPVRFYFRVNPGVALRAARLALHPALYSAHTSVRGGARAEAGFARRERKGGGSVGGTTGSPR